MSIAPATASPVQRLRTYASFVRLEHTLFSLPLILAGVFSARGPALAPLRPFLDRIGAEIAKSE